MSGLARKYKFATRCEFPPHDETAQLGVMRQWYSIWYH
jgi:hypothetical protein